MPKINLISIAETPAEQEQGLQFVRAMHPDSGMLFKFDHPRVLSFWMSNTPLPLEIVFIDHENKVVKTEKMIPMSMRSVSSGRPCVMALEVLSGTLDRLGISVGSIMSISEDSKTAIFGE